MVAAINNEVTVRFPLSLGQIPLGDMVDLNLRQQRRQRSSPFERFGMSWILTIEKKGPTTHGLVDAFNVLVVLYCLNVPIDDPQSQQGFPLRGNITDQEGRNAQTGQAFNLVGKPYPAHGFEMDEFILQLHSGQTQSDEVIVSMIGEDKLGGYYGRNWRGAGAILLEDHVFDPVRDGAAIEVMLRFQDQPTPVRRVE